MAEPVSGLLQRLMPRPEILPDSVCGVDVALPVDGEGEAGAVAQRQTEGAGDWEQLRGDARLLLREKADFALDALHAAPGVCSLGPAI